jgi:hypothetical protein
MVEKSMLDPQEIGGTPLHAVPSGQQHRDRINVGDDDTSVQPPVKQEFATPRDSQVDDTAIEYLDGKMPFGPRTIGNQARKGGYAQEGDQSEPNSGPRTMSSTRGASDIAVGGIPQNPNDSVV